MTVIVLANVPAVLPAWAGIVPVITPAVAEEGTIGTRGFWNLMLEIVFVLFTKTVFLFGLVTVGVLAIISFPLYGIWQGVMMMINHRASFEPVMLEEPVKQEPKLDKK